jgi:hypothetical protein
MKSDPAEYKDIIRKLLEKTRQRRVQWGRRSVQPGKVSPYWCDIGTGTPNSVSFETCHDGDEIWLSMRDQEGNRIFRLAANDLPTSPEEEEVSQMIDEIYDLARRQALKVEQKIELASNLLDRV